MAGMEDASSAQLVAIASAPACSVRARSATAPCCDVSAGSAQASCLAAAGRQRALGLAGRAMGQLLRAAAMARGDSVCRAAGRRGCYMAASGVLGGSVVEARKLPTLRWAKRGGRGRGAAL
jgi:hypothetical protein